MKEKVEREKERKIVRKIDREKDFHNFNYVQRL